MLTVTLAMLLAGLPLMLSQNERLESLEVVSVEQAPFTVLVFCNNNKLFCSGTLVHPQWVLTSANCLHDLTGVSTEHDRSVTVVAGANSLNFTTDDLKSGVTQSLQSERVLININYSWAENFINDLALIKVSGSFNITSRVAVVPPPTHKADPLPRNAQETEESHQQEMPDVSSFLCKGYGYGKVLRWSDNAEDFSLKQQQYEVGKHCHCLARLRSRRSPFNILVKGNMFLCDEDERQTGLCSGDDGGPLICGDRLRGIATTLFQYEHSKRCKLSQDKNECGDIHSYSVFSDVCFFSRWLHENIPEYPHTDNTCDEISSPEMAAYDAL